MNHSNPFRTNDPLGFTRPQLIAGAGLGAGALALGPKPAGAVLRLDITQGNPQPMPIALPDFLPGTAGEGDIAHNVPGVITNKLQSSGLFAPINPQAFVEKISNT